MTVSTLTAEERALVECLRHAIERDPFPMAPRLAPLKAMLAKLEQPAATQSAKPDLLGSHPG